MVVVTQKFDPLKNIVLAKNTEQLTVVNIVRKFDLTIFYAPIQ
ncbi:protein of unknown function [Bartonella clarridgeiae 73]|uniref:Uncharacterized protein n=1 Tax=Bartonella clarridgeiae (strain CCUG 45776 / CIP 104772 / 73) TaxID=696125 RepID=E6YGT4_BARC7|nr:protein of unknown function [Bartonella clarridgeiae 73]